MHQRNTTTAHLWWPWAAPRLAWPIVPTQRQRTQRALVDLRAPRRLVVAAHKRGDKRNEAPAGLRRPSHASTRAIFGSCSRAVPTQRACECHGSLPVERLAALAELAPRPVRRQPTRVQLALLDGDVPLARRSAELATRHWCARWLGRWRCAGARCANAVLRALGLQRLIERGVAAGCSRDACLGTLTMRRALAPFPELASAAVCCETTSVQLASCLLDKCHAADSVQLLTAEQRCWSARTSGADPIFCTVGTQRLVERRIRADRRRLGSSLSRQWRRRRHDAARTSLALQPVR